MSLGRIVLRALIAFPAPLVVGFWQRLFFPHRIGLRYMRPPANELSFHKGRRPRPMYRARDGPFKRRLS